MKKYFKIIFVLGIDNKKRLITPKIIEKTFLSSFIAHNDGLSFKYLTVIEVKGKWANNIK